MMTQYRISIYHFKGMFITCSDLFSFCSISYDKFSMSSKSCNIEKPMLQNVHRKYISMSCARVVFGGLPLRSQVLTEPVLINLRFIHQTIVLLTLEILQILTIGWRWSTSLLLSSIVSLPIAFW